MKSTSQQIMQESENLPIALQAEVLDFVRFLKQKADKSPLLDPTDDEPNGTKLARLMEEAAKKNLFADIEDPAAWQREIRKDRPLPGRE